ncbi:MAG: ribonuclease [Clostridia bacterium]|jgi:hypothetical protein|nr:ribonuclease [Clostridia bacterium]
MIIYTPVPPEVLWYVEERDKIQIMEGLVQGIPVQMKVVQGTNVVERVLSTDPAHFLNSACQPGSKII